MSVIIGLATLRSIFLSANIFCKTVGHLVENLFHMKNMAAQKQNYFFSCGFGKGLLGPVRKG